MGSDDTDKICDDEEDSTWGMCKTISLVMNYLTSLKAMSLEMPEKITFSEIKVQSCAFYF